MAPLSIKMQIFSESLEIFLLKSVYIINSISTTGIYTLGLSQMTFLIKVLNAVFQCAIYLT